MKVLTIRSDKPEAEVGLYINDKKAQYIKWEAHRQLSSTIHSKIKEILNKSSIELGELDGLIVFKGPGSFTGLRIGITLANALSYSLAKPIVGASGEDWIKEGLKLLKAGQNDKIVIPEYGAAANVTLPIK